MIVLSANVVRQARATLLAKLWRVALVAVVLGPALAHAQNDEVRDRPLRIVLLQGTDFAHPTSVILNRVVRETIAKRVSEPISYFIEALDAQQFGNRSIEPEFLALLQKKYRGTQVDLVISVTDFALDFAIRHRDSLWPGAPVVFHGVTEERLAGRTFPDHFYGLPSKWDIQGTLEIARRLQPHAGRVLVIGGSEDLNTRWSVAAEETARRVFPTASVERANHLSIDALSVLLQTLPRDSIVFFTTMYRDTAGGTFVPRDAVAQLSAVSNAPVYGLFETFLSAGIVGGSIASNNARAQSVGVLAVDVLRKRFPASPLGAAPIPSYCMLDHPALVRWGLASSMIPQGCTVLNRTPSFWEQYGQLAALVLAVILAQSGLIAYLLVQRRARRSAEHEVLTRRTELAHALRLATVGELTASLAHEINQPLGAILSNTHAAELLLADTPSPSIPIRQILAEIKRDDLRAHQLITRLRNLLEKHEMERFPLDINAAIDDVLVVIRPEAQRRRIELVAELAPGLPRVSGDCVHLQQVVLNLVMNAMDAMAETPTASRKVIVCSALRSTSLIEVTVADAGQGIPSEHLDQMFSSFFSTKPHGMGLGLSIARTIVEAHGGRIWAQSTPGRGAVLHFTVPAEASVDMRSARDIEQSSLAKMQ